MPKLGVTLALRKLRQEKHAFEASLNYTENSFSKYGNYTKSSLWAAFLRLPKRKVEVVEEEWRKEEVVGVGKQKSRMCVHTVTSHKPTSAWRLVLGNVVG